MLKHKLYHYKIKHMGKENELQYPRGVEVIVGPFIVNEKHELLMMTSPKWKDIWIVPGGHIEPGETMEQALLRETKEEIGVEIEVLGLFNVSEGFTSPPEFKRNAHFIFMNFAARLKSDNFQVNEEVSELRWFPIDEVIASERVKFSCREGVKELKRWLKEKTAD